MNKRGITSFAQDRINCAKTAAYAQAFCRLLPLPWHLKKATEFMVFHGFLHHVRCALEAKHSPKLWVLVQCFFRLLYKQFWSNYCLYQEIEGDICVLNGQKIGQIFMLAGAKAKGFKTHARQTHFFNATARYNFDFVDCYEVYTQEQAKIVGKKAKLILHHASPRSRAAPIILIASQPVTKERELLIAFAQNYKITRNEKLTIRFHPHENETDKALWRKNMQGIACDFYESDTPLEYSQIQLCISLNSALTIALEKASIPTICLMSCV